MFNAEHMTPAITKYVSLHANKLTEIFHSRNSSSYFIWNHHEVFKVKGWDNKDMVKYLPDGKEDCAEILLEGKWPIRVWKEIEYLYTLSAFHSCIINYPKIFLITLVRIANHYTS